MTLSVSFFFIGSSCHKSAPFMLSRLCFPLWNLYHLYSCDVFAPPTHWGLFFRAAPLGRADGQKPPWLSVSAAHLMQKDPPDDEAHAVNSAWRLLQRRSISLVWGLMAPQQNNDSKNKSCSQLFCMTAAAKTNYVCSDWSHLVAPQWTDLVSVHLISLQPKSIKLRFGAVFSALEVTFKNVIQGKKRFQN